MIFTSQIGNPEVTPTQLAELEEKLAAMHLAGQAQWPNVALPAVRFAAHLARVLEPMAVSPAPFDEINAADLYLAAACSEGDPAALALFDRTILAQASAAAAQVDPSPSFADEVRQIVREKLFVRAEGKPAKIDEYRGGGTLLRWVRAVVRNTARNQVRNPDDRSHEELGDQTMEWASSHNPEIMLMKEQHRKALAAALQDAFGALSSDERNLLRFRVVEKLKWQRIMTMFGRNRATVARWFSEAQGKLIAETLRLLKERHELATEEIESFVAPVRSQFELALSELGAGDLGEDGSAGEDDDE